MLNDRVQKFLDEHDCTWGHYPEEDHDFLIVHDWETVRGDNESRDTTPEFLETLSATTGYNPDEHAFADDFWGFSDWYTTCGECGNVVRTSPTSYGWIPDYWVSDCGLVCGDCVRDSLVDEYIENLTDTRHINTARGCHLLDPEDHGFTLVLEGLESGMHPGQADNPIALQKWANENGLAVLWVTRPSQFSTSFNGYFAWRECPVCNGQGGEYDDNIWYTCPRCDDNQGFVSLLSQHKELIIDTLVESVAKWGYPTGNRTYLKSDYRESPDLATRMEAALKSLSKPFAKIADDGSVREYDTIDEYMEDTND
jgi:hypothetical protein